jgi:hypothetical protein
VASLHVFSDQIDHVKTQASTPCGILGVKNVGFIFLTCKKGQVAVDEFNMSRGWRSSGGIICNFFQILFWSLLVRKPWWLWTMHCTLDWGQRAHSCLHYIGLCTSFNIPIPYITFVILLMKLLPFCFLLRSQGPQQLNK